VRSERRAAIPRRDCADKSGMEKGVNVSYDRLAELLARGLGKGASKS
jgi:hypothetical protein